MKGPSLTGLAALMKKPVPIERPQAPTADKWLNNFCLYLEDSYQKLVHPDERAPGLHCSTLYETCGRKEILLKIYKPPIEKFNAGQIATFEMGHMMHWWWQHRFLGPKQELWGDWYCAGCDKTLTGFMPMSCSCGRDWRDAISYRELTVTDKELGYTGHTDGILVDRASGKRRVFEFKSISPSEYKDLYQPKEAHIIQAHAYMRRLGIDEALIVYQNKGSQCEWKKVPEGFLPGKLTVKAFIVKWEAKVWEAVEEQIKTYREALAELNDLLKEGRHVTEEHVCKYERVCSSRDDEKGKYCPVRAQCFLMAAPGNDVDPKDEFRIPL